MRAATDLQQLIERARGTWNRALAVALLGAALGPTLSLAAVAALTGKVLGLDVTGPAAAVAVVAAVVLAAVRFAGRRVDDEQMAALLDLRLGGRGAVLHARDHGLALRLDRPLDDLTRPRPDGRRVLSSLGPGVAFLALTLLVPVRQAEAPPHERFARQRLEDLTELATTLDEVLELDEELQAELEQNLHAAREGLAERELTGAALQEALDQIEQRLSDQAQQAADALAAARSELARTGAALEQGAEAADLQPALDALAEELADLGALPDGMELSDLSELATDLQLARLDAGALDALAQLAERGLLDPRRLAELAARTAGTENGGEPRPLPDRTEPAEGQPGGT